jgi:hypothetical protein
MFKKPRFRVIVNNLSPAEFSAMSFAEIALPQFMSPLHPLGRVRLILCPFFGLQMAYGLATLSVL